MRELREDELAQVRGLDAKPFAPASVSKLLGPPQRGGGREGAFAAERTCSRPGLCGVCGAVLLRAQGKLTGQDMDDIVSRMTKHGPDGKPVVQAAENGGALIALRISAGDPASPGPQ